ncbi:MAG: hypothetical protein Aurels2KO_27150 [Aureliella sp.]
MLMVARYFALGVLFCRRFVRRVLMHGMRSQFRTCGKSVVFDPFDSFTYETIDLGDRVYIGSGARFSSVAGIAIGDGVMFGPGVAIQAGDHNISLNGRMMIDVEHKRSGDDLPVTIECDVWIGSNVTILKGVSIGRGAVVGAASVLTKDVEPYAIVVGNPARIIGYRGTPDEIASHEARMHCGT